MHSTIQEEITRLLNIVLDPLNLEHTIEIEKDAEQWRININLKNTDLFDHYLDLTTSVQHYIRVAIHKKFPEDRTHFLIDLNGERTKREKIISETIPQIAQKDVLREGNTIILVGLNGYERRIVHQTLAEVKGLETTSVGPEMNRKLVVRPTSETGSTGMDNAKIYEVKKLLEEFESIAY